MPCRDVASGPVNDPPRPGACSDIVLTGSYLEPDHGAVDNATRQTNAQRALKIYCWATKLIKSVCGVKMPDPNLHNWQWDVESAEAIKSAFEQEAERVRPRF